MLRRLCAFLLPVIVGAALLPVASGKLSRHQKQPNLPQQDTYRNTSATFTPTPSKQNHYRFDDYVGVIDTAGTTWYDYQHNGSCGRMIDLDESGAVSVAWMNGLTDSIAGPRHAYANLW
ncbi:MAG: hypothetical protein FJY66_04935, partial [Calditrichaeota bacterium]|nr:hypothetical protein [Calditrichota bacterium]